MVINTQFNMSGDLGAFAWMVLLCVAPLCALFITAVMGCAQRLPVAAPPEQRLITSMRDDVVNDRGRCHLTISLAHHAERMLTQVLSPGLLPLVAIAALSSCLLTGAPAACLYGLDTPGVQHWQGRLQGLEFCHNARRTDFRWSLFWISPHLMLWLRWSADHSTRRKS